jgi:1-acyl-sn-glycerol-3-phosphate acyltransferase
VFSSQGHHVLIDREDRRSQLRSFKQSIEWLKKGVPIVAFPEGRRSPDGRLLDFKGGLFAIASKAGVPIVPITLSHTHAVMPANSLVPVQPGAGKLHVHVHPAIDVEGKTEEELGRLVRECFMETLPKCQHPSA